MKQYLRVKQLTSGRGRIGSPGRLSFAPSVGAGELSLTFHSPVQQAAMSWLGAWHCVLRA